MKGSQGLDALATLCNGASKVLDNDNNRKTDNSNQTTQASPMNTSVNGTQAQATISQQLDQFKKPSVNLNGGSQPDNNSAQTQQGQGFNQMNSQVAALLNAGLPQQNMNKFPNNDNNAIALQQMVYLNLLQNQNVSNMITPQPQAAPQFVDQNALAVILALQQQQQQQQAQQDAGHHFAQLQQQHDQQQQQQQQPQFHTIIPPPSQPNQTTNVKKTNNNAVTQSNTFPAPRPKVKNETTMMDNIAATTVHQPILMRHPQGGDVSNLKPTAPPANETIEPTSENSFNPEDKKLMKRAANRRSAQLSRKRKKQYIEDLKEENADLRRMELILRSIPDLVISFDSSGKIGFVSQSVSNFLSFTPEELEGRSFWERLCQDSVRLLKAAFMDALAARENDSTSTPLGTGVWELRLQDKNKEIVMVTLNGVVHFTGDAPECVCSIRLCEGKQVNTPTPMKPIALPQQSVFNNKLSLSQDKQPEVSHKKPRVSAQISDIDTGSSCNDE